MISPADLANAIRFLSIDAVEEANSGHPGMPMGMATIAEVLWREFLSHHPEKADWPNRDRFVLSNGHGSMLLYSLLHLTGYDLTINDLRSFRQLFSKTPGHPEFGHTVGVETTTGPLGQGLANAVGMAIGERVLASTFNKETFPIIDHYTYVFVGDGCLMEGISHEVCSLAGTLGLGKLIAFWDDNGISIDGEVEKSCLDDVKMRFASYGWQVIENVDGHDREQVFTAISRAREELYKPTLICCRTIIGYGSPKKAGSEATHGAPLGKEEVVATREKLSWPYPPFTIPEEIYSAWDAKEKGQKSFNKWEALFTDYERKFPDLAAELLARLNQKPKSLWQEDYQQILQKWQQEENKVATRKASEQCLNFFHNYFPGLLGGSADLTGSNLTWHEGSKAISKTNYSGNYIHYGVREFGMSAIMNGLARHGGFIPYGGTFLIFIDYARNALRMSALMKQQVIYVLTHDSIGLGEDGPTHQPVEHLNMCRMTPNVYVWRPCDQVETLAAWRAALLRKVGPTVLSLSRQTLPAQKRNQEQLENINKGGYVLTEYGQGKLDIIILATGSEVELAINSACELASLGKSVRVVSIPCAEQFLIQDKKYQKEVLPSYVKARLAIEAGATAYWYRFVGLDGDVVGLDRFGESAPAKDVFPALGFSTSNVVKRALDLIMNNKSSASDN